jgi:TonB family protein
MNRWLDAVIALAIAALVSIPTHAADALTAARDLYAAAEYDDALALLNKLQPGDHEPDERRAIEQYRAYCLLALGRSADAEQAIAAVVAATPLYKPGADASPRVRSAFADVRRRLLPTIIQQKYAAAKIAFDHKNFSVAATVFTEVVEAMSDPDVADVVTQPPLADLRMLAIGFRDLSVSAAAPPPVPGRVTPPTAAPAVLVTPAPAAAVVPARIYAATDTQVLPPAALKQTLPTFPAQLLTANRGVLEIVIDEDGAVESATMRESVNPRYDTQVVAAAKSWQYRPAMLMGRPVKYRKMLQIDVKR